MDRRNLLGFLSAGAAAGCASLLSGSAPLAAAAQPSTELKRGLPPLKITDVKTILTAPNRTRLVIVKVLTSEPGLYGLGCATFTQRAFAVHTAVEKYLKPFLTGAASTRSRTSGSHPTSAHTGGMVRCSSTR